MHTARHAKLISLLLSVVVGQSFLALAAPQTAHGQTALKTAPLAEPSIPGPGFVDVTLPRISPEAANSIMNQRVVNRAIRNNLPTAADTQALRTGGGVSAPAATSIADMARALKHDPDLIYEYVRNNIDYIPMYGIKKGAIGAMIDGAGTPADQAELMVKLLAQAATLNTAIANPRVVRGTTALTQAKLREILGLAITDDCALTNYALNILSNGGTPVAAQFCNTAVDVEHFWVKVTISGTDYIFDPAFKAHVVKTGVDVAAAMGYNAATYLANARSGATITPDYVQNINRANVHSALSGYANTLISWIRANKPNADLNDIVGGKVIVPIGAAPLRQTALPYLKAGTTPTDYAGGLPNTFRPTLRVRYLGIDQTLTAEQLAGKRLTIFFNSANQPVLALDGGTLQTGTAVTPGTNTVVQLTATEIYPCATSQCAFVNQDFTQPLRAGGTYVVSNAWGPVGRGRVEVYRRTLQQAKASGAADSSEAALGSSLAILASNWIGQVDFSSYLLDRLNKTTTLAHHRVGIAGQDTGPYLDLPGNISSIISESGNAGSHLPSFYNAAMHSSVFESLAVQQSSDVSAVSTVKLIDLAASAGDRIYNATSANFASVVQPNLVNCASYVASLQAAVNAGSRLILPQRCTVGEFPTTANTWKGLGYFDIRTVGSLTNFGAIISGGLQGGYPTTTVPSSAFIKAALPSSIPTTSLNLTFGNTFGDPIDMFRGGYLYSRDDITVGQGAYPYALGFQKLYSSNARLDRSEIGNGWTYNFKASAKINVDGYQGMGEDSPIDAATSIVEKVVALDLLKDAARPLDKIVIATLGQRWFADQLLSNTVVVTQGQNAEVFVKLPDGSYNPPPASNAKLTRNTDGTYKYETLDKVVLNFNTAGNIASWVHPTGVEVAFTYNGANQLTNVANNLGRSLTLAYSGSNLTSVSDGNGRSVSYSIDAAGNLVSFTDTTAKLTTFEYDLPGRMTRLFYPTAPTAPYLINVYDSFDRVLTQTNANGKLYTYHFSGNRSEEVAPDGSRKIGYQNALGKMTRALDGLLRETKTDYDGLMRPIKMTMPEGNQILTVYDVRLVVAPRCAAAITR